MVGFRAQGCLGEGGGLGGSVDIRYSLGGGGGVARLGCAGSRQLLGSHFTFDPAQGWAARGQRPVSR